MNGAGQGYPALPVEISTCGEAQNGIPTMARRRGAGTLRVKAVKTRVQINVRLDAERGRGQTDLQAGMPQD